MLFFLDHNIKQEIHQEPVVSDFSLHLFHTEITNEFQLSL